MTLCEAKVNPGKSLTRKNILTEITNYKTHQVFARDPQNHATRQVNMPTLTRQCIREVWLEP